MYAIYNIVVRSYYTGKTYSAGQGRDRHHQFEDDITKAKHFPTVAAATAWQEKHTSPKAVRNIHFHDVP